MGGTVRREEIVAAARELFRRQGLHATTMQQVAEAAGVPKGSLSFHFPGGKQELAVAVTRLAGGEVGDALQAALADDTPTARVLETLVAMIGAMIETSGFRDGCPVATIALEAGDDETLHVAARRAFDRWTAPIAARLERDGLSPQEAADLATVIVTTVEGAMMFSRAQRSLAPLEAAAAQLAADVDRAAALAPAQARRLPAPRGDAVACA